MKSCLSVCLPKNSWHPAIFLNPDEHVEAFLAPNEALIIQE